MGDLGVGIGGVSMKGRNTQMTF